jgi:hypothetical protein
MVDVLLSSALSVLPIAPSMSTTSTVSEIVPVVASYAWLQPRTPSGEHTMSPRGRGRGRGAGAGVPTTGAGGEVDVYRMAKRLTLDIAAQVFVGVELGPQADLVNDALVAMMRASVSPLRRDLPGTSYARGLAARRRLQGLLTELTHERRAQCEGEDLLSGCAVREPRRAGRCRSTRWSTT